MKRLLAIFTLMLMPVVAHGAQSCPTGYVTVDVPDMEFGNSCSVGWTNVGDIDWCGGDSSVCALSPAWTITFDYNSGSGSCAALEYGYWMDHFDITCTPTRPGYKFDGWTTTKNGTKYVTAVGTTSGLYWQEGGFTLYAHWSVCAASTTSGACNCPSGQAPNGSGGCATIQTAAPDSGSCPAGYIEVEIPDLDIVAGSCDAGWVSAGEIDWCTATGGSAGVCALEEGPTCPNPGYYVKNGKCIGCKEGLATNAGVYCPGDDAQNKCPTWAQTNPNIAEYERETNATFERAADPWTPDGTVYPSSKQSCRCSLFFSTEVGRYLTQPAYDESVQKYWNLGDVTKKWYEAYAGYYLSNYFMTEASGRTEYYDVKACSNAPEKAHYTGAGTPDDPVKGGKKDYNDCPWECDDGFIAMADAPNVCVPRCDLGYYRKDGECTICPSTSYCPGDNTKIDCPPDPENREGKIWTYYTDEEGTAYSKGAWLLAQCLQTDIPVEPAAVRGKIYKRCFYNENTKKYNETCHFGDNESIMHKIGACDAGYYWPGGNKNCFDADGMCMASKCAGCDCVPAGYGNYSPEGATKRTACPEGESTFVQTATTDEMCYPICTLDNRGTDCVPARSCPAGQYLHDGICYTCPENGTCRGGTNDVTCPDGYSKDWLGDNTGYVCERLWTMHFDCGDGVCDCPDITTNKNGPTFSHGDGLTCTPTELPVGYKAFKGWYYEGVAYPCYGAPQGCWHGGDVTFTAIYEPGTPDMGPGACGCAINMRPDGKGGCELASCGPGKYLVEGECYDCPESHPISDEYAEAQEQCYVQCLEYSIEGGTLTPVADTSNYPAQCEFNGMSENGNPCIDVERPDGTHFCRELVCQVGTEMKEGTCVPCNREHALSYKENAYSCTVQSCEADFYPSGDICVPAVQDCTPSNAVSATRVWDEETRTYGPCKITECEPGYHVDSNACVIDTRACTIANGAGTQDWNPRTGTWDECVATQCVPGFTTDVSLAATGSEVQAGQCAPCANKYGVDNELAVSSYVRECEIASCMYQGEKYVLEGDVCRPICLDDYDHTGTRTWNPRTKRCERECLPGYTAW